MKDSIRQKLDGLRDRFEELEGLLSDADVIADQQRFRDFSREYSELEDVVLAYGRYRKVGESRCEAQEMRHDADPEIRAIAAKYGNPDKLLKQHWSPDQDPRFR